jgi:hypothetical protein
VILLDLLQKSSKKSLLRDFLLLGILLFDETLSLLWRHETPPKKEVPSLRGGFSSLTPEHAQTVLLQ